MGKKARPPLRERESDPSNRPEVLAVRNAVDMDHDEIGRQVWLEDWFEVWEKAKGAFDSSKEGSAAWGNAAMRCFDLLVKLEQVRNPEANALPAFRPGKRSKTENWGRKVIVHYLKTGEYSGPGKHGLPPPVPLWTQEELGYLVAREGWADVLRDMTRSDFSMSAPGSPKPLPGAPQRWRVMCPFVLGRRVDPGIAWAHWSQIILSLAKVLASSRMSSGPSRLPVPAATRDRLLQASKLLGRLAARIEIDGSSDSTPDDA